jgi:hypothetical protein
VQKRAAGLDRVIAALAIVITERNQNGCARRDLFELESHKLDALAHEAAKRVIVMSGGLGIESFPEMVS